MMFFESGIGEKYAQAVNLCHKLLFARIGHLLSLEYWRRAATTRSQTVDSNEINTCTGLTLLCTVTLSNSFISFGRTISVDEATLPVPKIKSSKLCILNPQPPPSLPRWFRPVRLPEEDELLLRWFCSGCGEYDDVGDNKFTIPAGEIDEIGFGLHSELKFGQVPLLRCSDAVRDGFEAEKRASHKKHPVLAATWGGAGGFDGGAGEED
ncbi:hypothetical protein L6452_21368 [Arctium lappa]|uniref:Uncharacterized protein n=1 Tax=Arctium lappa TaxID=4217 RepID=A0ACB9BEQ9_ARCLA|nr:hypothetical protein L6452_21368 [Arctium lappa]